MAKNKVGRKMRIVEYLAKGPCKFEQIRTELGIKADGLSACLYTLKTGGIVTQDGGPGSLYRLTSQGSRLSTASSTVTPTVRASTVGVLRVAKAAPKAAPVSSSKKTRRKRRVPSPQMPASGSLRGQLVEKRALLLAQIAAIETLLTVI